MLREREREKSEGTDGSSRHFEDIHGSIAQGGRGKKTGKPQSIHESACLCVCVRGCGCGGCGCVARLIIRPRRLSVHGRQMRRPDRIAVGRQPSATLFFRVHAALLPCMRRVASLHQRRRAIDRDPRTQSRANNGSDALRLVISEECVLAHPLAHLAVQ